MHDKMLFWKKNSCFRIGEADLYVVLMQGQNVCLYKSHIDAIHLPIEDAKVKTQNLNMVNCCR